MAEPVREATDTKFSLVIGGPFYRMLARLGLLGADLLPPLRTAIIISTLAWLPLVLLSMLAGTAWNQDPNQLPFLLDYAAHARYLIAILVLLLMESFADRHVGYIVWQFINHRLLEQEDRAEFFDALRTADHRSSSDWAELIILIVAYGVSLTSFMAYSSVIEDSWLAHDVGGRVEFAAAGWWALLVSLPLFWFLFLRWIWRFIVWARLLKHIARLRLRLVATHPDRCGGLGFMTLFPLIFTPMVFALSCVMAAVVLQNLTFGTGTLIQMGFLFAGWVIVLFLILIGPLVVFAGPLLRLKRNALLEYSGLASHHNLAFEDKWTGEGVSPRDALGSADISSVSDLGGIYQAVYAMRIIPVKIKPLFPLCLAAALPWLAVLAATMPLEELIVLLKGVFL